MAGHPNGVWIWRWKNLAVDALDRMVERHVKRVYLKVFDGKSNPMIWRHQCSPEFLRPFRDRGIEVYGWGYHYGTPDVDAQVAAVSEAMSAGLSGYVVDVEVEVKDPLTHAPLRSLLERIRPHVPAGALGYTSFGHPGFHTKVPWSMLNDLCDLAFPQIYFESFRFKPTNEEEVQACVAAHASMGLTKQILPIWSSEPDVANPATASELQGYLNRFPGSSIWRVAGRDESTETLNVDYAPSPVVPTGGTEMPAMPALTRLLKRRIQGEDVKALQRALNARGFVAGEADGDFGAQTERAVRAFQLQAGLTNDGVVGPDTWAALGGPFDVERPEQGALARLADIAQAEASLQLRWTGPASEAEKYLQPFRAPMRALGHLGTDPVFYNWCAAFVTFCCRKAGIAIPDQPPGYFATMALVESWKFWAKKNGFWHPAGDFTPRRGDILVFEWNDGDVNLDHIGIVRGYQPGSPTIETSEGNKSNQAANATRNLVNVPGFIRIIA